LSIQEFNIQSLDIVINCIYGSGEAKLKISFPFFVGSAHFTKLKKPSRLRLDGFLTQILKCGEGGIRFSYGKSRGMT